MGDTWTRFVVHDRSWNEVYNVMTCKSIVHLVYDQITV